jgi:hypothetical protein
MLAFYRRKALALGVAAVFTSASCLLMAVDSILEVYNPAGVRADGAYVDKLLKSVMVAVGKTRPPMAGEFPEAKVEKIAIRSDAFTEVNDLFYKRGWGDGLPIVPPTVERVKEMLKGTDLAPDKVICAVPPKGGQATVEKIAVNAVMAGCRPEYLPVLIAAVAAVSEPDFNLSQVGTTTGNDSPLIIVSGPVAKELDINSGSNALGRGWKANATIGRALHMIINNIGGSWPGVNDMSTLGNPGDFANCLAEIEEKNPWEPLRVELGYAKEANIVTVVAAESFQAVVGLGLTSEQFLNLVSDRLVGLRSARMSTLLLILNYDTVDILKGEGWVRAGVKKYLAEHARIPSSEYKKRFLDNKVPSEEQTQVLKITDPSGTVPAPAIDRLLIVVAGGPPGEKDMIVPVWSGSKAVSKVIKLPANWKELVGQAGR